MFGLLLTTISTLLSIVEGKQKGIFFRFHWTDDISYVITFGDSERSESVHWFDIVEEQYMFDYDAQEEELVDAQLVLCWFRKK